MADLDLYVKSEFFDRGIPPTVWEPILAVVGGIAWDWLLSRLDQTFFRKRVFFITITVKGKDLIPIWEQFFGPKPRILKS